MKSLPLLLDAALLAIVAIGIFDGYRKGLIKTIASLLASAIGICVSYEYARPLALRVNEAFARERVSAALTDAVSSNISAGIKSVLAALPDYVLRAGGKAVEELKNAVASGANASGASERLFSALEKTFIIPILTVVSFLAIFVICKLVLSVVVSLINAAFKLPVIRSFNGILGGIAGAAKGAIGACVVRAIFYGASVLYPESAFSKAVANSRLQNFVWNAVNSFLVE